jgi:hypothetical protein
VSGKGIDPRIEVLSDVELVAFLRRLNPFGGYQMPRNVLEREMMQTTAARWLKRGAKP